MVVGLHADHVVRNIGQLSKIGRLLYGLEWM